MQMTMLWLIRHGETLWNAEGRVQGQTDVPLSEIGHTQARALADHVVGRHFDALYSSDLQRVMQSAQPTARVLGLEIRVDPMLRERHFGLFETLTIGEAKERYPHEYARFKAHDAEFDFRDGERLRDFFDRSVRCLADIAARHVGEEVLVFTHGGVLDMAYRHARGLGLAAKRDFEILNAALNQIEVTGDRFSVLAWADRAHLESVLDTLKR
jgi:probable phosphoglycerate mutase